MSSFMLILGQDKALQLGRGQMNLFFFLLQVCMCNRDGSGIGCSKANVKARVVFKDCCELYKTQIHM